MLKYIKFIIKRWAQDLNSRGIAEKLTVKGRIETALHSQTNSYLKPLCRKLKTKVGVWSCARFNCHELNLISFVFQYICVSSLFPMTFWTRWWRSSCNWSTVNTSRPTSSSWRWQLATRHGLLALPWSAFTRVLAVNESLPSTSLVKHAFSINISSLCVSLTSFSKCMLIFSWQTCSTMRPNASTSRLSSVWWASVSITSRQTRRDVSSMVFKTITLPSYQSKHALAEK